MEPNPGVKGSSRNTFLTEALTPTMPRDGNPSNEEGPRRPVVPAALLDAAVPTTMQATQNPCQVPSGAPHIHSAYLGDLGDAFAELQSFAAEPYSSQYPDECGADQFLSGLQGCRHAHHNVVCRKLAESAEFGVNALDLSHLKLGADGVQALCSGLAVNKHVTSLCLANSELSVVAAAHVCNMLCEPGCRIALLDLSKNPLGARSSAGPLVGESIGTLLGKALQHNKSLLVLRLQSLFLTAQDASPIMQSLIENTALVELDLCDNQIDASCGRKVRGMLEANSNLAALHLSWNTLRDAGCKQGIEGMLDNTSPSHLSRAWNGLGDATDKAVQQLLQANSCLQYIDLNNNRITGAGSQVVAAGVSSNTTLKVLLMQDNPSGGAGKMALQAAAASHPSLE
eukprot:gene11019-2002_t